MSGEGEKERERDRERVRESEVGKEWMEWVSQGVIVRERGGEREGELDNKKYERYDNKVLSIKIIVHCTLYNLQFKMLS